MGKQASRGVDLAEFGHHLIVGISGSSLTDDDKKLLEAIRPVGILLLARNFLNGRCYQEWLEQLSTLLGDIKRCAGRSKMFFTLDHEGGTVIRTPSPITRFPYAYLLRERAYDVARASARELLSLGVNVSWAPVADVHSNPSNPIIGYRAFSSNTQEVAAFAKAYAQGLAEMGVIGCAKHFPGHGDTNTDSHLELPVLNISKDALFERELVPFRALCQAGIPMIMTAHVLFPPIDPAEPATFSKALIQELLRHELRYEGIIVSDDLEMKAISRRVEDENAVVDPFIAGCDLTIVARYAHPRIDHIFNMAQTFGERCDADPLFREQITQARGRIEDLLERTPMPKVELLSRAVLEEHAKLAIEVAYPRAVD